MDNSRPAENLTAQPPALLDTYCATAWISAPDRREENDGMTPAPLRTMAATVAAVGFRESRFGPVVPLEPAALSVWQPAQLFEKTGSWNYAFYASAGLALCSALAALGLRKMPLPVKRGTSGDYATAMAGRTRQP